MSTPSREHSPDVEANSEGVLQSPQAIIVPKSNQLFSRHGIFNQRDIIDDSENLAMPATVDPQPLGGQDLLVSTEGVQHLDLLPPVDPSPTLVLESGQQPTDPFGVSEVETDAFQGALDEFYYDPNSIAVDPFNWSSSYWNTGDFGIAF